MNGTDNGFLSNLGLDPYYNAVDRLGNNPVRETTFDFDTKLERDSITSAHLRNASIRNAQLGTAIIGTAQVGTLTFNQISGGTATLGGTTNGNGLLIVKSSSGGTICTIDNTGITVSNGSITIQDTAGSNVIDSQGVVSTTQFVFGGTSSVSNGRTNASWGSWVDVANTSVTIVLGRTQNVLLMGGGNFEANTYVAGLAQSIQVGFNVDGTLYPDSTRGFNEVYFWTDVGGNGVPTTAGFAGLQHILSLGAGTHTAKMQWQTNAGTAYVNTTFFNYLILGK